MTAGELLAPGYVFKNADGYVSQTTAANSLTEVTVVKCDHDGYTSGTCRYCGEEIEAKLTLGANTVLYTRSRTPSPPRRRRKIPAAP